MKNKIGFMQGRLSPMINGKIQAFPWEHWKEEFASAKNIEMFMMEWTLDQEDLYKNPFMTKKGQEEILDLCKKYNFTIPSLTGDCFMQAPFYKAEMDSKGRLEDFENIVKACGVLGVTYIVFPLVDNGSLKTEDEENFVLKELTNRVELLEANKVKIVFESDYPPVRLKQFIAKFPKEYFGINYDLGNSASLGFEPSAELRAYGDRVLNVHIKDRKFEGTTVPLGTGDVNFEAVFTNLKRINYNGNFILQTARSQEGQHEEYIVRFTKFVLDRYL